MEDTPLSLELAFVDVLSNFKSKLVSISFLSLKIITFILQYFYKTECDKEGKNNYRLFYQSGCV